MARTERDVMRGKRWNLWVQVTRSFGVDPSAAMDGATYRQVDAAFQTALRTAHVYDHECSYYCLMHWAKRHARRRFRARARTLLRHQQWEHLKGLRYTRE